MSKRLAFYLGLILSLYLILMLVMAGDPIFSDFAKFHASAQLYFEGASIYSENPVDRWVDWSIERGPNPGPVYPNLNPPFLTLILLPLASLSFPTAYWIWSALSLGAGMAAMSWIESETREGPPEVSRQLVFQLLLLAYYPTFATLQYGQVTLFLFLFLVAAWVSARRGRDLRAGCWLGLAVSLKPFFGLFGLLLLVLKRWWALVSMTGVFAFSIGISMAVFGWETLAEYRSTLGGITWAGTNWNASFLGLTTRLLGGSESPPLWHMPEAARLLAALASVSAAILLVVLVWPRESVESVRKLDFDLGFSLTTTFMLLISPLGWLYYFPLLLLSFVIGWYVLAKLPRPRRRRFLLIAAFVGGALPVPLASALESPPAWHWYLWSAIPSCSLLLLAYVLSAMAAKHRFAQ